MQIKYTLSDNVSSEVLAELKEHLEMNGYDAQWQGERSFVVDEEMAGYVDTIIDDRNTDYYSEPLVKWYDNFEMENNTEGYEEDCYFTFLVGETIENEGEEYAKTSVYVDMRGYLDGAGEPCIYCADDQQAYLRDEGGYERYVHLPDDIYDKLGELTKAAVLEEKGSKELE